MDAIIKILILAILKFGCYNVTDEKRAFGLKSGNDMGSRYEYYRN